MKSKIGIKIITIAIGILALSIGIVVTNYHKQQTPPANQAVVEQATPISNVEKSSQPTPQNEEQLPQTTNSPVNSNPQISPWGLLKLIGIILLFIIVISIFFIAILAMIGVSGSFAYLFKRIGIDSLNPRGAGVLLIISLALPFGMLFLPRSQALVFRSWNVADNIRENSFFYDMIFGAAPNRYDADTQGRITALYLNDNKLQNFEQIPGIENLSSLQHLEISDSPLEGTIDVSLLTELEELHLRNTNLKQIVGLNKLTKLNRLNLEGSPVEKIDSIGTVQKVNLSRTKITDLSALAYLPPLKEFTLEEMDLSRVHGLESLPPVDLMSLRKSTRISLERLGSVKILILDGSDVTDLSPLANLQELNSLSIFETKVESLKGLENSKVAIINTDNPNFTPEKLERFFNRKIFVTQVKIDTFSFSTLFPPHIWQLGTFFAVLLLSIGILLLLPLPQRWRNRPLLKIRRIMLFIIPGAFLVLGLWMMSNLEIPLREGQRQNLESSPALIWCAIFIALIWLVITPSLRLLLDTKTLGQSAWSVSVFRVSRLLVIIAVISPFPTMFLYALLIDENTSGFGSLMAILMFFLYLCFTALLGIITYVVRHVAEVENSMVIKLLLLVTLTTAIPSFFIALYVALRPNFLSGIPGIAVIAFIAPALLIPVIVVGVKISFAHFVWLSKKGTFINILNGDYEKGAIVEIPFRQNPHKKPLTAIVDAFSSGTGNAKAKGVFENHNLEVLNAQNVGQITSVPVTIYALNSLDGVIVIIQSKDLLNSKDWEFISLRDWLRDIYQLTWSPIWFIGDWVGDLSPTAPPLLRKIEILDSLNPYISGLENLSVPGGSVFEHAPPDNIVECLEANQIVNRELLFELGLLDLLGYAPTPIAMMLRSVFGQPHLANRLDTIVRTVETAVAVISLVLLAEYEHQKIQIEDERKAKLEKTIKRFFETPNLEFSSWASLFNGLIKNKETPLAGQIATELEKSTLSESQKLREMVETIGGAKAVSQVRPEIKKVEDSLALLIAARNVITAHGAATERAAPELYRTALIVALDFLNALQWQSFTLQAFQTGNRKVTFQGCIAEPSINEASKPKNNGVFVEFSTDAETSDDLIDVSKFFKADEAANSLAIFTGVNRYNEPISGLTIDVEGANTA